eukprot:jgi/Pico_ML_1/53931/g439.t1
MLPNLVLLILSDNFISGGLDALAELPSLEELNLSNNKIASLDDLKPLAPMGLISLDLYQCPIVKNVGVNYREEVFKLLPGLKAAGGEDELADIDDMDFPEADEDEGEEYGTERLVGELANDDDDDEGFEPIDENPESEDIDEEDDESGPSALKRKRGFEDDDDLDDEDDDDDE